MKKVLILFFILFITNGINVKATPTGHKEFTSIEFVDGGSLLSWMSDFEIKEALKNMGKAKFWGWKDSYICLDVKANYVGDILFSKSNRTKQSLEVDYYLEEVTSTKTSTKVTGSISAKVKGDIKKINGEINGSYEREKTDASTVTKTEETKIKVTIRPNTKVTYQVVGEAYVTNGLSKYYIFGINVKQGSWEYIAVETRYYELIEEELE